MPFMSEPLRILIIRLSALGDILHALPAFNDLRTSFPNAQIDWLVAEKNASLLNTVQGISSIRTIDTSNLLKFPMDRSAWSHTKSSIRRLRAQRYDVSIDFQGLLKTAILGYLIKARTRVGFSRDQVREPPAHWFYTKRLRKPETLIHITALNRKLAEMAGANSSTFSPLNLVAPEEDELKINRLLENKRLDNFIVINPGGGWPTKRWSPERYGLLANKIQNELKIPVVVTTGPGEENMYNIISSHCRAPVPHHLQVSFIQLIPLLKKALLFVAGDTGPFHLACATGTPVVGIFGPTSPVRNGPWRDGDETVIRSLPCSFCHKRACKAKDQCMDIAVDEVFAAVNRRLQSMETRG
jgi:heptosyltransferase I